MNLNDYKPGGKVKLTAKDKKTLKDFQKTSKEITKEMDNFRFYTASEKIYHYFWHVFCDKIIEEQKSRLNPSVNSGQALKDKAASQHLLMSLLSESLKILHPFMPFITEEIYQQLPLKNKQEALMVEEWPQKSK
jgi:valyl-tRNA synthetase